MADSGTFLEGHSLPHTTVPSFLESQRTLVMGVLNVTPNSFSDGGKWLDPEASVEHGLEMVKAGADLIDVGGESTFPGRTPVSVNEEIDRVLPVIQALVKAGVLVSCDTMHAKTAQIVAEAGVRIINDVSGGIVDESMFSTIQGLQDKYPDLSYIVQHWRGQPDVANQLAVYQDVPLETWHEIEDRLALLEDMGIDMSRVIIDPGLGFSKVGGQDWDVLANLDTFLGRGYPVLIGPSRKRYLSEYESTSAGRHPRDDATAAVAMYCALKRVWAVRVHEVAPVAAAVKVAQTLEKHHQYRPLRRGK